MTAKDYIGSSLDDFLEEEGIQNEVTSLAIKRTLVWQIQEEMKKQGVTKKQMAEAMEISESELEAILNPENVSIALDTVTRVTNILGKKIEVNLVDIS